MTKKYAPVVATVFFVLAAVVVGALFGGAPDWFATVALGLIAATLLSHGTALGAGARGPQLMHRMIFETGAFGVAAFLVTISIVAVRIAINERFVPASFVAPFAALAAAALVLWIAWQNRTSQTQWDHESDQQADQDEY